MREKDIHIGREREKEGVIPTLKAFQLVEEEMVLNYIIMKGEKIGSCLTFQY